MRFQLRNIILWPKNADLGPRILDFQPGMLNVITGASRTGKSAIIPIIDYCLGSEKCSIPVETIRDRCSWFGVVVETTEGVKLLARREPGDQRTTGDMFIIESQEIEIPAVIESHNTNVTAAKHLLDDLAGLTNLDFGIGESVSGFQGRPSFRDMGAFIFQPQNVMANPDVLFYKADTYEHREKLRSSIFPYVLNAVTPRILAAQHELVQLKRELRHKQAERSSIEQVSQRWMAEIQSRVDEARELGLITADVQSDTTREQLILLLEQAVAVSPKEARVTDETINEALRELQELRHEESNSSQELVQLRRRLSQMNDLQHSSTRYQDALYVQRDRLSVANWLSSINNSEHECPVCGNTMEGNSATLNELVHALHEVEESAGAIGQVPAAFDREYQRVRQEVKIAIERLDGIHDRIKSLEERSTDAQKEQYQLTEIARFAGRVENALKVYRSLGADSALTDEIVRLEDRVRELSILISSNHIQDRIDRALRAVEANAARILPLLDAERPDLPINLSINDLTIKVVGPAREDYLWEIGSGSNWLSYHVAVTLALQQFFIGLDHSPVPSLLVYDQPSQVYFPRKLAAAAGQDEDPRLSDEDLVAISRVYNAIDRIIGESNGNLQVTVLDHAGSTVWEGLSNVHLVEEWRDGRKLIPMSWLE